MEIIKKKICLEPFKSRFNGNMPTVETMEQLSQMGASDGEATRGTETLNNENISVGSANAYYEVYEINDWDEKPYDIVIPEGDALYDLRETLPLVKEYLKDGKVSYGTTIAIKKNDADKTSGDNGEVIYVLRFGQMVKTYSTLRNMILNGSFYRRCKRGAREYWAEIDTQVDEGKTHWEYFFSGDTTFTVESSVNKKDAENGDTIFVTDEAEWFNKTFQSSIKKAKYFVDFAQNRYNGIDKGYKFTVPYVPVSIYLEEEYDDMGVYSTSIEEWVAGKHYYNGDIVYHDNGSGMTAWQLELTDVTSDSPFDLFELTNESVIASMQKTYPEGSIDGVVKYKKDGVEKYYLKKYYDNGKYDDETMLTSFNTSGWTNLDKVDSIIDTEAGITPITAITAITKSYLSTFKLRENAVDDDGVSMPFNLNKSNKVVFPYTTYLCHMHACDDDNVHCDILQKIEISDTPDTGFTYPTNKKPEINVSFFNESGYIRFTYIKDAIYDNNDENPLHVSEPYITYEETYAYTKEKYTCKYTDGGNELVFDWVIYTGSTDDVEIIATVTTLPISDTVTASKKNCGCVIVYERGGDLEPVYYMCQTVFEYIALGKQEMETVENGDIDSNGADDNFSKITYNQKYFDIDSFQDNIFCYKKDALMGMQNSYEDIDASVERGKSAAFERHLILGEVNTFEDLVNYRNDYFGLKKNQNQ